MRFGNGVTPWSEEDLDQAEKNNLSSSLGHANLLVNIGELSSSL